MSEVSVVWTKYQSALGMEQVWSILSFQLFKFAITVNVWTFEKPSPYEHLWKLHWKWLHALFAVQDCLTFIDENRKQSVSTWGRRRWSVLTSQWSGSPLGTYSTFVLMACKFIKTKQNMKINYMYKIFHRFTWTLYPKITSSELIWAPNKSYTLFSLIFGVLFILGFPVRKTSVLLCGFTVSFAHREVKIDTAKHLLFVILICKFNFVTLFEIINTF